MSEDQDTVPQSQTKNNGDPSNSKDDALKRKQTTKGNYSHILMIYT